MLRSVVVRTVVDLFIGIGAFEGVGLHGFIVAPQANRSRRH